MFLSFPSLREDPFRIAPAPRYLFLTKQHATAKSYIDSSGFLSDGFVVITGEIGSGKTILVSDFLSNLAPDVVAVKIYQTQITPVQFLQCVLAELGFSPFNKKKAELLSMVNDFLLRNHEAGRRTVLVIDEAQNLSLNVLEEIRLLSGIETGDQRILSVILAGQPGFKKKLYSPRMEQLAQRAPLHFHLQALSNSETERYIRHRLRVAGCEGEELFEPGTFDLIHRHAGGVPRRINTLCSTAMLCAYAEDESVISTAAVNAAIAELERGEGADTVPERLAASSGPGQREELDDDGQARHETSGRPEIERGMEAHDENILELGSDLSANDGRVAFLEDELERLEALESEAQLRGARCEEPNSELATLAETIAALRKEYDESKAERVRLSRALEDANADKARLATKLQSQEALIESYQQQEIAEREEGEVRLEPPVGAVVAEPPASHTPTEQPALSWLVRLDGEAPVEHSIQAGVMRLGSDPDNDIRIRSEFISPHHAQLISGPKESILGDLGSTNGTYVNSQRVERYALRDGDLITIGRHRFKYVKTRAELFDSRSGINGAAVDGGEEAGEPGAENWRVGSDSEPPETYR
jgi:type II secretory pathway predicted ATPase ExeA